MHMLVVCRQSTQIVEKAQNPSLIAELCRNEYRTRQCRGTAIVGTNKPNLFLLVTLNCESIWTKAICIEADSVHR